MKKLGWVGAFALVGAALVGTSQIAPVAAAQQRQQQGRRGAATSAASATQLTGLYRINIERSDKLYSVVAGASSNLPFGEQQKFFIDLTERLTPPDLLAIERRGRSITLASSRAPRIDFDADGLTHSERSGGGQIVRTRAVLRSDELSVTVSSGSEERFSVTFEPLEAGRFLRVTRRLSNEQLTQPVLIRSVYEKLSELPQWDIYNAPPKNAPTPLQAGIPPADAVPAPTAGARDADARLLRRALDEWIAATNARNIERQMSFYPPVLRAYYLSRNTTRGAVRADKERVFSSARSVDVRADAPELVFQEAGRAAVMRFRKRYVIEGGVSERRGEVIQELRWQLTPQGWKIFSERDVRVVR